MVDKKCFRPVSLKMRGVDSLLSRREESKREGECRKLQKMMWRLNIVRLESKGVG